MFPLDGDSLVGEVLMERSASLPTKGDVVELPGRGDDWYSVQSVDPQLGPDGDISFVLVMVDDFSRSEVTDAQRHEWRWHTARQGGRSRFS